MAQKTAGIMRVIPAAMESCHSRPPTSDADPAVLVHVSADERVIDGNILPEAHGKPLCLFDGWEPIGTSLCRPVCGNIPHDAGLAFGFRSGTIRFLLCHPDSGGQPDMNGGNFVEPGIAKK